MNWENMVCRSCQYEEMLKNYYFNDKIVIKNVSVENLFSLQNVNIKTIFKMFQCKLKLNIFQYPERHHW
jgi:hypothetical protein